MFDAKRKTFTDHPQALRPAQNLDGISLSKNSFDKDTPNGVKVLSGEQVNSISAVSALGLSSTDWLVSPTPSGNGTDSFMSRNRIISRERKPDPVPQIHELTRLWLEAFQLCVNQKDYEMARGMFSPGVVGFGTVAYSTNNLDELVSEQWEKRWPLNESFEFDIQSAKLIPCRPYLMVAVTWVAKDVDGTERKGRATLMLIGKKEPDGPIELMCVHSHYSCVI